MADDDRDVPDDTGADVEPADVGPAEVESDEVGTAEVEPDEPERVTPEVVADAPAPDAPPPIPGPTEKVTLYRMVRLGLTTLMLAGALTVLYGVFTATNPDSVVCTTARSNISDELDADEPDPSVSGLTDDDVDDLSCDDAVALADGLDDTLPEESGVRSLGIGAIAIGALMVSGAVVALMLRSRRGRTIALMTAGVGLLGSVVSPLLGLGFVGLGLLGVTFFALYYSRDAKASYGDPRAGRPAMGGGLFRPRVPPPPKD
jgi:hypothetical protein